ncbi:MAG: hypothetical protein GAK28_01959 [Luteibacter sp.]|uniref:TolC family protein n=1 Tax=Luteibacter sp. TaxID=1886636 RepID=UPI001381BC97|nr:TolC family protein [Luteibacter sp.]KAF1007320.1 MAG: hypothetical protein GAK28_01959 [Luteibacter sp.]
MNTPSPRRAWCAAVLGCLVVPFATAGTLSLDTATNLAVRRTPLLDARRAQAESARQEVRRAGALPDPQLTVGIDNLAVQGPGAFTAGGDDMTMRTVGVTQVLPSSAKRGAQRQEARARVEVADADTVATALLVRRQAAEAWIAVSTAQDEIAALNAMHRSLEADVDVARARLRGGGSAGDVLAARASVLDVDNRTEAARGRLAQARAQLARWLGDDARDDLAEAPDYTRLLIDGDTLLGRLDDQAALLGWAPRERLADAALAGARAERHPDWSIGASYGSRVRGLSDMVSLQVGVSLPLFTRNRQDRGVAARLAEVDAIHDAHEDARREQKAMIQAALADWRSLGEQVRRQHDDVLPLAEDRGTVALAGWRGGGDIQPLLQARRDELAARLDDVRLRADQARAWASLAFLLPQGTTP